MEAGLGEDEPSAAEAAAEAEEPVAGDGDGFLKSEMMSARMEWGLDEEELEEGETVEVALAEAARGAASTVVAESLI